MSLLAVFEVAERLGVSTRQVQHLVARGDRRQVARGVLDETSVERLLAVRGGSHKRAWSEFTAWGAVAKAGLSALAQAQAAFAGAASDVGVTDEGDVQALVDDLRGRVS